MPLVKPTPRTWTLRFKINRTTILLHVDPQSKMHLVRAELLKALQATFPEGKLPRSIEDVVEYQHNIPDNADDIILARPVDINNLSAGWEPLDQDDDDLGFDDYEGVKGKGKGKATTQGTTKSKAGQNGVNDCPQGAGLRDGGVVAVRFRTGKEKEKKAKQAEEDVDVDEIAKEGLGGDDEVVWDVMAPSIEETYGEEDVAAAAAAEMPLGMSSYPRAGQVE